MKPLIRYTIAAAPLSAEEIQREFARFGRSDAFARALRQILQERLAAATVAAAAPRLSEREAGHAGGRLDELLTLSGEFESLLDPRAAP